MPRVDYEPMEEDDLLKLIDDEINASICFENDGDTDSRDKALEYYRGVMTDVPAVENWSEVASKDVSETVDLAMPGIMRVFDAPDIVSFTPANPKEEKDAEDAGAYLNFLWEEELDGYSILYTAAHDALTVRNGLIKHYWDHTPTYSTETLQNLDMLQMTQVEGDPEVQVLGFEPTSVVVETPEGPQEIPLFNVRVRRKATNGKLVVENVAPEDFGISSEATSIAASRCHWHRMVKTRSDLVKEGFDRELVADIPSGVTQSATKEDRAYAEGSLFGRNQQGAGALEEIELYEVYLLADVDGDGVAERIRALVAGGVGGRKLLEYEEWPEDEIAFTDLTALLVPHRWMGRSIADSVMDLQRIKTVLFRQFMDNLYAVNRPMQEVVTKNIVEPSEILRPRPGQKVRVKEAGSIRNLEIPFIGDKALMGVSYIDKVIGRRTGVSESTAALDETAIDPQTATAEQIQHDAAYARVELMVRTMAKRGLKALFGSLLRLVVKHQDRPRMVKLRKDWVSFDPRPWNASMGVKVKIGQGTGSRERDLAMLTQVGLEQDKIIEALGQNNPIVKPSQWVATRHKKVVAAGLDDPDQYFSPVSDEEFGQWAASRPEPTDPKAEAAKAQLAIKEQESQGKLALAAKEQDAKMELERQKAADRMMLEREQMAQEAELEGMKVLSGANDPGVGQIRRPWNG